MNNIQILNSAFEAFLKREFSKAEEDYRLLLLKQPHSKEARLGIVLCDLAKEDEEEAVALFDYYIVLKEEKEPYAEEIVMEIIETNDSLENSLEELAAPFKEQIFSEGISYSDFKEIIKKRGSFKEAYEDIMFSTKVIITEKDELFDFIDNLISNGFKEQVYSYIEDASRLYPLDSQLRELFEKLDSKKDEI